MQVEPGEEVQGLAALDPASAQHLPGMHRDRLRSASTPDALPSSASAGLPARGTCDTLHSVRFNNMSVIHEEAAWVWTGGHDADSWLAGFRRFSC